MEKSIRIIIADPDTGFAESLAEHIEKEKGIEVCAVSNDGTKTVELVKMHDPDVLITDVMLKGMDGLSMISSLRSFGILPHTIVLSGFLNENMVEKARQQGAEHFFLKPCHIKSLVECIRECAAKEKNTGGYVERLVRDMIISYGIMPHLLGFGYLRDAVVMTSTGQTPLRGITKILYPDLARRHKVSDRDVERCIRHAIKYGWDSRRMESTLLADAFPESGRSPTNLEFIGFLTTRVQELMALDNKKAL